jgi:hypothetical protein
VERRCAAEVTPQGAHLQVQAYGDLGSMRWVQNTALLGPADDAVICDVAFGACMHATLNPENTLCMHACCSLAGKPCPFNLHDDAMPPIPHPPRKVGLHPNALVAGAVRGNLLLAAQ